MPRAYFSRSRAERLIAAGRVVLAAFSLLAISLDPAEPAKYAPAAYALLSAYVTYAILVFVLVWRSHAPHVGLGLVTHATDLATFAVFMYLTEGPTSPFFVYFVFAVVCGTLRWQWRGTLWTAAAALVAFVGSGVYAAHVTADPTIELNRFIIRSVYLSVVAVLIGYLGAYEERLRSEISRLAAAPHTTPRDAQSLVRETIAHAAGVLGTPRALMIWGEPEEPWLHVASWSEEEFRWTREPPDTFQPPVAEILAGADFLCLDARTPRPTVLYVSPPGFQRWVGLPVHRDLQARLAADAVLSVSFRGDMVEGRLFALDRPGLTSDDLLLARIVARQTATRLDHFYLSEQLQQAAAAEERVRLARDLHDGLLQSLTGAALQLQTVRRLLTDAPVAAQEGLLEVQRLIAAEQRDLRTVIRQMKPGVLGPPEEDLDLRARLAQLCDRVERQWGIEVTVKLLPPPAGVSISEGLAHEVYRIVHEALVNAARHAGASEARVAVDLQEGLVRITVGDNGHGFPFRGRYDLARLIETKQGPATLKERIASLNGDLAIDSTESGASLEITLPLAPPVG